MGADDRAQEWEKIPTNRTPDATREIRMPAHRPALVALVGSVAGKSYPLADELLIGRAAEADLQLSAPDVSRRHARIWREDGGFHIEDLGSCNGTLVDGVPLTRQQLRFGNRIQLGASTVLMLTHHSALEDRLIEQQKLEAVGRLASGVAGEFSRVLAEVRDGLDWIRQETTTRSLAPSELRERIAPLEATVSRAFDLTGQLLAFARQGMPQEMQVDLRAIIDSVVKLLGHAAGDGLTYVLRLEPDLVIDGDPLQLQQVLMSLCQYAEESVALTGRGGQVTITARRLPADLAGEYVPGVPQVLVAVADDGGGMDAQTKEQLFEPFLSSRTARGGRPSLAAVHAIVRNHNGHLELDSEPGKGTVFRIYLPEHQDSCAETVQALPAVGGSAAQTTRMPSMPARTGGQPRNRTDR